MTNKGLSWVNEPQWITPGTHEFDNIETYINLEEIGLFLRRQCRSWFRPSQSS